MVRNKKLVLGCAGGVGIFGSTFTSTIEGNGKPNLETMSTMAGEPWIVCLTPFEALKAPEIQQTCPFGERGNYEKY